jgi:hypothetical protein
MGKKCPTFPLSLCFLWVLAFRPGEPTNSSTYEALGTQQSHSGVPFGFQSSRISLTEHKHGSNSSNDSLRIALCVRTCRRPQMLRRCLTAISKLTQPEGAEVRVIVGDNEPEPKNRAAVKAALSLSADFLAFTDDDCEPTANWLCDMLEAQRHYGADVVRGRLIYRYPAGF